MSVTVKELKERLINALENQFSKEGFSFNKSEFAFKKKDKQSNIQCYFTFYPFQTKVEYNFTFTFLINELEDELKKFHSYCGTEYIKGDGMYINEGDFHPIARNKPSKFRIAFTHIITDFEKDYHEIEDTSLVLQEEFFPRLDTFSNLQNFQKFIRAEYNRAFEYGGSFYALLALKLEGPTVFNPFLEYVSKKLNVQNLDPRHIERKAIENITAYANQNGSGIN
jgi:hypothetical protein